MTFKLVHFLNFFRDQLVRPSLAQTKQSHKDTSLNRPLRLFIIIIRLSLEYLPVLRGTDDTVMCLYTWRSLAM